MFYKQHFEMSARCIVLCKLVFAVAFGSQSCLTALCCPTRKDSSSTCWISTKRSVWLVGPSTTRHRPSTPRDVTDTWRAWRHRPSRSTTACRWSRSSTSMKRTRSSPSTSGADTYAPSFPCNYNNYAVDLILGRIALVLPVCPSICLSVWFFGTKCRDCAFIRQRGCERAALRHGIKQCSNFAFLTFYR